MAAVKFDLSKEELQEKIEMDKFVSNLKVSDKQFIYGFLVGSQCSLT